LEDGCNMGLRESIFSKWAKDQFVLVSILWVSFFCWQFENKKASSTKQRSLI
jgi:hypothetical protein